MYFSVIIYWGQRKDGKSVLEKSTGKDGFASNTFLLKSVFNLGMELETKLSIDGCGVFLLSGDADAFVGVRVYLM